MHCTGQAFQFLARVVMPVSFIRHIVIMIMRMRDRMRMRRPIVSMRESVLVLMRVMSDQSIGNNKCGSSNHYN